MLDNLYIHKIQVVRYGDEYQNDFGEFVASTTARVERLEGAIGDYIPCRIETYQDNTEYNLGGLREANKTIIYIPPQYRLELQDRIYWKSEYIGLVKGINPALKGTTDELDHYEIILENK